MQTQTPTPLLPTCPEQLADLLLTQHTRTGDLLDRLTDQLGTRRDATRLLARAHHVASERLLAA